MSESYITQEQEVGFTTELLAALAGESGAMRRLLSIGYSRLNNPIIVTDKSWKALAMTTEIAVPDDKDWVELTTTGMLSSDSVAAGIQDKLADRIEQSVSPFIWKSADMRYPRMFSKITVGERSVATISVIEYARPFESNDAHLLKMLSEAVSAELQKNQFQQYSRGMMYEDFIWNLLEENMVDPKSINERARVLGLNFKKNIYVFVFDLRDYDSSQYSLRYMRDMLENMISGGRALIYENKIVMTASSTQRVKDYFGDELGRLAAFLAKYGIHCGISRRCVSPINLRLYYEQALDAMRIGRRLDADRHLYTYGEYAVYTVAQACADAAGGVSKFVHPALDVLLAYDREYGTSYMESLYTYLRHFKNITNAANELHLHRNTMVYHLKRIEEIMDVSFDDYDVVQMLELSFRLLEFDKKTKRPCEPLPVPEAER